jgi:Fe-S oxidoreductase
LEIAKKEGTKTAQGLDHWLRQGIPVLACEPSCASALNDDLPDIIDDPELSGRLKSGVQMIDQFLAGEVREGRLKARFRSKAQQVLIHGHCHQKALYGTQAMKDLLEADPSVNCSEIPSGWCGLAGCFGYEKEHYDLSRKIGSEILFPAVKEAAADTEIVACGFSCRHQIQDFTGRRSRHWVEVIEVL